MKHIKKVFLKMGKMEIPVDNSATPKDLQSFKGVNQFLAIRTDDNDYSTLISLDHNS